MLFDCIISVIKSGKSVGLVIVFLVLFVGKITAEGNEDNFVLIYQGSLNGYLNPVWAPNSKTFSIQTINKDKEKTSTLYVYQLADDENVQFKAVFPVQQHKKKGPQKRVKYRPQENTIGWFTGKKGAQVLYSATNRSAGSSLGKDIFLAWRHTITSDLVSMKTREIKSFQEYSGPGDFYIEEQSESILLTFLSETRKTVNRLYPYYKNIVQLQTFKLPVQSICGHNGGSTLFAILGKETVYEAWISYDGGITFERIDIPSTGFTILTEALFSTQNSNLISFIGANSSLREDEKAVLCVYDLKNSTYIKRIDVFRHKQPPPHTHPAYHQWHPDKDQVFYMRSDEMNRKRLLYWDFIENKEYLTTLPETNLKTFKISPDGQYLITISNDRDTNMRIYRIRNDK